MFDGSSDSDSSLETDSSDDDSSSESGSALSLPSDPEILDGIAPGGLQLNTQFESEEDATIFRGISRHHYENFVVPLKNGTKQFLNYTFHSQLSDDGKRQMGVLLAQNHSQIEQMKIKFSEERPRLVSGAIFRGGFTEGHALQRFIIRGDHDLHSPITLSLNDWNGIKRYLTTADSLSHLDLNDLVMGRLEVDILVSALAGAQLKTLKLSGLSTASPNDGGVDSLGALLSSMNVARLKTVDIVDCNATARGTCEGLANIIRNDLSKLELINLDGNPINDECVGVLCQSLKQNASVRTIHLHDMDEITDDGWKLFKNLVFDKSSIENIYLSNHNLQDIKGHPSYPLFDPAYINKMPGHTGDRAYLKVIRFLTNDRFYDTYNGGWQRSIWELGDECFNIQPFVDYDVEIMPYVLGFFGTKAQSEVCNNFVYKPLFFIYQLLRLWDIPTLFGFGSAEKARLSAAYSSEINALKDEVETLRTELSKLKTGNTLCDQKQTDGEDEEKQSYKRTRVDT